MSATNRSQDRVFLDIYPTPAWCVQALLRAVPLPGGLWMEPAAGDGALIRAVQAVRDDVVWHAIDIRSECRAALEPLTPGPQCVGSGDYLVGHAWEGGAVGAYSVVITNPPFSLAEEFVRHSLRSGAIVAMLLRLNWLGSQKRAAFLRSHTPDVYVLPKRPSFTGKGTDACEYAWMVWSPAPAGAGLLRVLEV